MVAAIRIRLARPWRGQVKRYHYLGCRVPFGAHLRYWVRHRRQELACRLWTSPLAGRCRRETLDWLERQTAAKQFARGGQQRPVSDLAVGSRRVLGRQDSGTQRSANAVRLGPATGVVPCAWKLWWMRRGIAARAIELPTGSTSANLPGAVARIANIPFTVKPSKISISLSLGARRAAATMPRPRRVNIYDGVSHSVRWDSSFWWLPTRGRQT